MDKKQMKNFVNENGFFTQIPITLFDEKSINALEDRIKNKVPEDAFLWGGVASTETKNLNGYGIRLNAWKSAISDYMKNPIILLQHKDEQALGLTLQAKVTDKALEVLGYIRRQADQAYAVGNIEAGVYGMLSTGHYTLDFEWEHKDGTVKTREEFQELIQENGIFGDWINDWTAWVTDLKFVEWSVVSVGANEDAFKTTNSLELAQKFYKDIIMENKPSENDELQEVVESPENGESPENDEESQKEVEESQEVKQVASENEVAPNLEKGLDEVKKDFNVLKDLVVESAKLAHANAKALESIQERLKAPSKKVLKEVKVNVPTGKTILDIMNMR